MDKQYSKWIYLSVLLFAGAIFGSLLVQSLQLEQREQLAAALTQYLQWIGVDSQLDGTAALFWSVFAKHLQWIIIIFICGLTIIGIPFIIIINFLKGFMIGFSISMMVQQFGIEGLVLALVSFVPQNLFVIPALIILSGAAIGYSGFLVKNRLLKHSGNLGAATMNYSSLAITILLVCSVSALIEAFLSPHMIQWYTTYAQL